MAIKGGKKKKRNPRILAVYLFFMGLFIAELLFYTWCRVQSTQARYEISKLTDEQEQMLKVQDNLKIELARLKSPQRIARIATEHLGLVAPTSKQLIIIP
jgi:cell division protein FtsL